MRVLVTGATAPLGRALVAALLDRTDVERVLAVGVETNGVYAARDRLDYRAVDLTRSRSVHDLLRGPVCDRGIDTVIHGVLHRSASDRGPRIHAVNVEATRQLLLGCEEHPTVRRFVYRSAAEVYAIQAHESNLVGEDQLLEFDPSAPQWLRDRVEADLLACARMGMSPLSIAVLRCAEVLAPGTGSQLWDYLQSRVCLRPLGFDPMINVLSIADCVAALIRAAAATGSGVYNIAGADTLPLRRIVELAGRIDIPVSGPLLAPLYWLRRHTVGLEFRYDLNLRRFHFGGVLDGRRAASDLDYSPRHPIHWPGLTQQAALGPHRTDSRR